MRILFVHNAYQQIGGEDAVVQKEVELLKHNGSDVYLLRLSNDNINGFFSRLKTALDVKYSYSSRELLHREIRRYQPDVVHVHNFFPLLSPSIYDACTDNSVPVVQTLHNYRTICPGALLMRNGNICEKCINGSPYNAVLYSCYRDSMLGSLIVSHMVAYHRNHSTWQEKVDRFIVLTEFARQKFIQANFPSNKIAIKPNFTNCEVSEAKFFDENKFKALFVGRLSHEKGVSTLLSAWKKISLPLLIIGDGPLLENVKNSGLDTVIASGLLSSSEVSIKMSKASFLIMPSEWYEGFPMVLVEAFSHGLPVIASRLGGMAEIVEDGVTGLHFEAGNSDDLADKVLWLQNHPEECKEMGDNARRAYQEKYTSEINNKLLMQIYQEVIDEKK